MDILEDKFENICRSCLSITDSLKKIEDKCEIVTIPMNILDLLNFVIKIDIRIEDNLPTGICDKCENEVVRAYLFIKTFIESDKHVRGRKDELQEHYQILQEEQPPESSVLKIEKYIEDEIQTATKHECLIIEKIVESVEIQRLPDIKESHEDKLENEMDLIQEKLFKCDTCSKNLSSGAALRNHKLIHSDKKLYLCSHCGKRFRNKPTYDSHLLSHNPKNQIKCEVCGKVYKHLKSLKEHMLCHGPGGKPFLCGICGAGLAQRSGLEKHMLIHTGEKPFECDICGKSFRYSSVLILHKRKHTGARPYPCNVCDLKFGELTHLKRHQMVHTGEKPYACDLCDKRFNRRSNLRVHRKIHTGERSYVCKYCGKAFIQGHCLKNHMVTHHEMESPIHHKENPRNRKVPVISFSSSDVDRHEIE